MTLVQHSRKTVRWGTPADIVERARRTMGGIDLDPCSESKFQETVKAATYYSLLERGQNGLELPWTGRVLVNPPGGLIREFWRKLIDSPIDMGVWIGFSMEQLGLLADMPAHPSDFSICFLRRRISFVRFDDRPDRPSRPSHANFVVGLNVPHTAFLQEFGSLGKVQAGGLARL